jgi:drug/metabolite transporter (DMT)-like permease
MYYRQNLILGAALILVSELMFASMGAVVKHASLTLPNEMLVFMRNFMGMLILLPILLRQGLGSLRTEVAHLHLLRAVLGVSAMYCFFYALAHLPLANGVLLKMTAPIFMPVIAWLWLREGGGRLSLVAIPLGFFGVMLVLEPGSETGWVALVGVLGGFFAAWAKVTVRRLGRSEPTTRTVFYFAVLGAVVSFVPMLFQWRPPSVAEWWLLLLIGLFGSLGQLLLTRGYAVAPAARIGPFTYFSVVYAAIFGYLFWGETLDRAFVAGAGLIIVAGVLTLYRTRPQADATLAPNGEP